MSNPFQAVAQAHAYKMAEEKRKREERKAKKRGLVGTLGGAIFGGLAGTLVAPGVGTLMGASAGASLGGAVASEDPQAITQAAIGAAGTGMQMYNAHNTAAQLTANTEGTYTAGDVLSMGGPGGTLALQQGIASLSHTAAKVKLAEEQTIAVARANSGVGKTTSDDGETAAAIKPTAAAAASWAESVQTTDNQTTDESPKPLRPMAVAEAPAPKLQTPFAKSFAENREKFNTNMASYSNNAMTALSPEPQVPLARLLGDPR